MSSFKKLNTKIYKKSEPITPDFIYWKQLKQPVLVKEFGPVDYIDFSPQEPYYFAVTCSVRVQVYNPITKLATKNLSRFRENAYGAVFRNDGTLILSGGEEKNIKLFDVSTKSMLRLFKGHTAPVHRVAFIYNQAHIASFSDDKTVKVWDIPTESTLHTFEGHTDYVRAGVANQEVSNILLSGGYDNIIKVWDTRTDKEVMTMNHGSPVESLIIMPNSGMFLSAGGTDIKIWDALAGGKLRGALAQHHKTITCLRLASNGKRLFSGSLDRHVKIYDISTFKVVHTLDYSNAVLSLGISKDDSTVAAGLVDGVIAIQRRLEQPQTEANSKKISSQYAPSEILKEVDDVVYHINHEKEAKYNHHLRKHEYSKVLSAVLLPYVTSKNPEQTVAVLRELKKRKALRKALHQMDLKIVKQLIRFFNKHITDLKFSKVLIDIAIECLDIISESAANLPADIGVLLVSLDRVLKGEDVLATELALVQGMLQTLLACQVSSDKNSYNNVKID